MSNRPPGTVTGEGQIHRRGRRHRSRWWGAGVATLGLLAAACGSSGSTPAASSSGSSSSSSGGSSSGGSASGGGSIAKNVSLKGAKFKVASLNFTEMYVLGNIAADALKAAGANVSTQLGLAGVNTPRQAMLAGKVNLEWNYTSTGWTVFLKKTSTFKSPEKLYDEVAKADLAKNHIKWFAKAPLNDTYGIGVNQAWSKKTGVTTVPELVKLIKSNPSEATFCTESDFRIRPDGLPLVEKTYGFTYPANLLHTLTLSLIYPSIAKGSTCHFGEIYTTAPQLTSDNLVVLKDPKSAFLVYNPAVNVPVSIYKKYPQLSKLFGPISAKLTTSVITHLNYEVDIKGESAATVAANWLKKEGFTA